MVYDAPGAMHVTSWQLDPCAHPGSASIRTVGRGAAGSWWPLQGSRNPELRHSISTTLEGAVEKFPQKVSLECPDWRILPTDPNVVTLHPPHR